MGFRVNSGSISSISSDSRPVHGGGRPPPSYDIRFMRCPSMATRIATLALLLVLSGVGARRACAQRTENGPRRDSPPQVGQPSLGTVSLLEIGSDRRVAALRDHVRSRRPGCSGLALMGVCRRRVGALARVARSLVPNRRAAGSRACATLTSSRSGAIRSGEARRARGCLARRAEDDNRGVPRGRRGILIRCLAFF